MIANEIGELFSALRDTGYATWESFAARDYALFFEHFRLQEWYEQYRKLAALDQEAPPPLHPGQAQETAPVAAAPMVPTLLVPAPALEGQRPVLEPETPVFNGMDTLLEEMSAASEPVLEPPVAETSFTEPATEPDDRAGDARETEIRQTIQDAWFWLEKGYTERGFELFRLALEQHPREESLQEEYQRARMQYGGNGVEALEKPDPTIPAALENLDTAPAAQSTEEQSQEAATFDQMGENALAKGDFLLAKYCWDRVADLQPQYPGIFRKLALLTSDHLTDYKETAAFYLDEALEADPDNADLHFRLALLQRDHLNQPGKALQHFRDTVVLQPDNGRAWLALAQFTLEAGDHGQAEALYRHACEVDGTQRTAENDALFLQVETAQPDVRVETPAREEQPAPRQEARTAPATPSGTGPLTVLVTGATSGIGRATAELFARNGHRVILAGRQADLLRQIESSFQGEVHALVFDVRSQAAVEEALRSLPEAWQEIDLLINNAGLAKGFDPIHEGNLEHWETMIDTNVKGLLYVTRCIAPGMVKRRKGHIINIGSSAGKEVYPNGNVYCATKFAVDALTRAMRLDLYRHNIRVSQVSPGHVEETGFALTRFDGDTEKAQIYGDFQPLKAADVAEAVYFIATRPAHVNIQDIWMFATQQASATLIDRSGR